MRMCKVSVCVLLLVSSAAYAALPTPTLLWEANSVTGVANGGSMGSTNWVDNQAGVIATPFGVEMQYHANGMGTNAIVRDNSTLGNNQWWVSDAQMPDTLLTGTSDYTLVAVARPSQITGNVGIAAVWGSNADYQWYTDGTYIRTFNGGTSQSTYLPTGDSDITDAFGIYIWQLSSGTISADYADIGAGDAISLAAVSGNGIGDMGVENGQPRRLNFMNSAGNYHGDFAEFILYDSAISTSDLADLDAYIDAKYVIPEPATMLLLGLGGLLLRRKKA